MKITYLIYLLSIICLVYGCKNNSGLIAPKAIKLRAPHKINCENMFVVGDKLIIMNNSDNFFFDYFHLPDATYIGSFGHLSRDGNGFSMIPSPDRIKVTSDTSFISDDRLITISSTDNVATISPFQDYIVAQNNNIDSILNSKVAIQSHRYSRSNIIDGKIYSLYYKKDDNGLPAYKEAPELHVFNSHLDLQQILPLTYPIISYTVSARLGKLYTISDGHTDIINVYRLHE